MARQQAGDGSAADRPAAVATTAGTTAPAGGTFDPGSVTSQKVLYGQWTRGGTVMISGWSVSEPMPQLMAVTSKSGPVVRSPVDLASLRLTMESGGWRSTVGLPPVPAEPSPRPPPALGPGDVRMPAEQSFVVHTRPFEALLDARPTGQATTRPATAGAVDRPAESQEPNR